MLIIADVIVTDSPHPKCAAEKHKEFISYYERMKQSEDLGQQDHLSFELIRYRLTCHILNSINIIVCTFATARKTALYRSIRPALIVCEKSFRVIETNIVIILSNCTKISLILIDDDAQFRPMIKNIKENDFAAQLEVTFFERFILLGQTDVLFQSQHRFVNITNDMISKYFYRMQLLSAFDTALSERNVFEAFDVSHITHYTAKRTFLEPRLEKRLG